VSTVQEASATPEVKKVLADLRKTIQEKGHHFQVGTTSATGRPIEELAGTRRPPNLKQLIVEQNRRASAHLAANPRVAAARFRVRSAPDAPNASMPSFDWSQRNVVGSVKNQGRCGDCWNFATVGVFESMYAIRHGAVNLLDLSEEQLLRCNTGSTGSSPGTCCGGWWGFDYVRDGGLFGSNHLAYSSTTTRCLDPNSGLQSAPIPPCSDVPGARRYKAAAWGYVSDQDTVPSPDLIKHALCQYGPLICAVYASPAFMNYTGGLFDEGDNSEINHAVMIVGWTKDPTTGKEGWIVRNSWGSDWGDNGYILIAYGSNSIGLGAAWVEPE
jgi:cathepsin L